MVRVLAIVFAIALVAADAEAQMRGGRGGRGGGPGMGRGRGGRGGARPASGAISAKAGLIVVARGDVRLDGERVTRERLAEFPHVAPGSNLQTTRGRAEVLLAPKRRLYLSSATRFGMVDDSLDTTEISLERGALIIDVSDDLEDQTISVVHRGVRFVMIKKGRYRLDSAEAGTAALKVFSGAARVEASEREHALAKRRLAIATGEPAKVELGKFKKDERDGFDEFVEQRSDQLASAEARQVEREAQRRGWPTIRGRGSVPDASQRSPRLGGARLQ